MPCNITGTITNSISDPLNGALWVKIDSVITDEDSSTVERVAGLIPVADGEIDIELVESETFKVTYNFKFYLLTDQEGDPEAATFPDDFEQNPIIDFHAIVPDLPIYGWEDLRFQTGITTTAMSTAALVVAKEMLTNPNLLPIIDQALGISRGLKPVTPVNGQAWIDSDTSILYRFNSTQNRWLSDSRFIVISIDEGNDTYPYDGIVGVPLTENFTGLVIKSYTLRFLQTAVANGSNNHLLEAGIIPVNTTTKTTRASISTNNGVVGEVSEQLFNDGTFYTQITLNQLFLRVTQAGSPGDLEQATAIIEYQLVS